jgi:hypothetical protein
VRERNLSCGQSDVQERNIQENHTEDSFEAHTKVTEAVDHALLSEGEVSSLADHQISPLDANNGDQVTGLSELKSFSGVADRPVRDDGVSVEPWEVIIIRLPSALGVSFRTSEWWITLSESLTFLGASWVRVVKSNIDSGVDISVPTKQDDGFVRVRNVDIGVTTKRPNIGGCV